MPNTSRLTGLSLAALSLASFLALGASVARADHGCSDERVSLPDGPGSIGGVGDNVHLDANMGSMSTSVSIELPDGFEGATPSLSLEYGSSAGSGEVGYGWSFPISSIERMRMRGLPVYDESDEIVADGGTELVRTGIADGSAVYRARFEGAFVRYRWHEREGGAGGYWTAERPDGSIAYYGADETGAPVRAARVETRAGEVYRWHVVAVVDRFGHAIRYAYAKDGEHSLVDEITYAHDAEGEPLYSVRFAYEVRPDPITTGEPGFLLALTRRLSEVRVLSGAEVIRRYLLSYEDEATSGGASRVARVEQRGRGDALLPIAFRYEYSRSLDGTCAGACDGPFVVDMGMLPAGVDLRSGRATLVDMNGDALPDIVSTSLDGRHTIVPAQIDPDTGVPSFGAAYPSAATTASTAFVLSAPGVQVLDVNGDGFTDMIDSRNGDVLCNDGTGDWSASGCLMNSTLPVLEDDGAGDANPRFVRFLDYDDDRRIDLIRTLPGATEVFVNTGESFVPRPVEDIGAQFDASPTLTLADLNGDGLQDPVEILTGATQMRYRLNLGYGRWTPWTTTSITGFGAGDLQLLQLEDVNGDGMADVVLVAGNEVRFAVNRGDRFDDAISLTSADVTGDVPERVPDTTVVLFADMNGSGSRDVVWVTGSRVQFLELFPTRPNLISRIENGLGSVQQVEYGSSVLQQARDLGTADAWEDRLPYPVNVVIDVDLWNRLTGSEHGSGLHDHLQMVYHHGFYDGAERAFRGFARVERVEPADPETDSEEGALTVMRFDVGASDPYRAGRLLHEASFAGEPGSWRPMREVAVTYDDCPLAEIPSSGLRIPVRYVCETRRDETAQEGAPEAEWATTRVDVEHDGYGQVVRRTNHGVEHRGSPARPVACGADCVGDEEVVEIEHVDPGPATGGAWILGRSVRVVTHDGAGGPRAEIVTYYDGPDFVGLPEGQLTRGAVTRVRERVSDDAWIEIARLRRDAHGNVIESLMPRGALDVLDDHRRIRTYDADGLRLVREETLLHDAMGRAIALRREIAYEPAFGVPALETAWMLVRDGEVLTPRDAQRVRYDAFGRPIATLFPGDPEEAPTREYAYELGDPVSRVVLRSRSVAGGPLDSEEIQCLDGLGRRVQTRTRVREGEYQVSEYIELNRRGRPVRQYQPHLSSSGACDTSAPSAPYIHITYDSQGRPSTVTHPDDGTHDTRSFVRYEYEPLATVTYDVEDTDASSAHAATPVTERYDGLGRLVELSRDLGDGAVGTSRLAYDGLGHLVSVTDALGEIHEQSYDLAGRVVSARDPSSGTTTFTLDADGQVIERRDARGRRSRKEYDALGRVLAEWDPDDEGATRVTFTYDADDGCGECGHGAGRLVSASFSLGALGAGRDELGYDARGRMIFQARTIEGHRYVTQHEHDLGGRPLRSTLPGGIVLERSHDDATRLTAIEGVVDDITYDERGQVATLFYANGVRAEHRYDTAMRLRSLETAGRGGVLQGAAFERDRAGNILAMRDLSDRPLGGPGLEASFAYDAWYRVTRAAFGAASEGEVLEMDYDLGDRVLRRESSLGAASRAHVGTLEYDADHPDRLVRARGRAYTYDVAGHVTERGTTELSWDHLGRLVEARGDASQGTSLYGAGDGRIAKLEDGGAIFYLGPEVELRDGIVYVYPRVGQARLARLRSAAIQTEVLSDLAPVGAPEGEINAADAWIAHAARAGIASGADEGSDPRRLLRGAARRLLTLDGGDLAFLHYDYLGSTTLATDADGETLGETLFYPNGEIRHHRGFVDEHGFTGQEEDPSSGLVAFRHRHLDPEVGRWMSSDPAFAVLSGETFLEHAVDATSLYAYVGNQVTGAYDPDGLATAPAAGGGVGQRLRSAMAGAGRSIARGGRALGGRLATAGRSARAGAVSTGRAIAAGGRAIAAGARSARAYTGRQYASFQQSAAAAHLRGFGSYVKAHPISAILTAVGVVGAGIVTGGAGAGIGIALGFGVAALVSGYGVSEFLQARSGTWSKLGIGIALAVGALGAVGTVVTMGALGFALASTFGATVASAPVGAVTSSVWLDVSAGAVEIGAAAAEEARRHRR